MKFNILKDNFLNSLQKVQSVIPLHSPQPILYNVLLVCEKEKIVLTATDTFISMECSVEADAKKKGEGTIPLRRLFNIVRELPEQQVEVEFDEKNTANINCGASSYKVFGLSAEAFPLTAPFEKAKSVELDQGTFKEMLRKTVYAASTEDSRVILNGVFLNLKDQKVSVVATDGRRLALMEQEAEVTKDAESSVVLPTKAVNELVKSLGDEGNVKIELEPKRVAFETEDMRIVAKLIEGEYPNYHQVIPGHFQERVTADRESLLAALRRVALVTNERLPSVKIKFEDNRILISCVTPNVGEAHEAVPVKYSGKHISAAFNPNFLMDPLRNLTCDEIFMEIVDDISPIVMKCDIPFIYVVMPLRVD